MQRLKVKADLNCRFEMQIPIFRFKLETLASVQALGGEYAAFTRIPAHVVTDDIHSLDF